MTQLQLGAKYVVAAPVFRTAVIDPPWFESGGGGRGAQNHYPLLRTRDMPDVVLGSGLWNFHDDAHLYCWATDNFLEDALWLVGRLGFRYVRQVVWVKVKEHGSAELRYGIGQYARGAHEVMLFCVRGRGQSEDVYLPNRDLPSVILAPVPQEDGKRVHSRKPPESYEWIERRSRGPYLECFARVPRSQEWTTWGNDPSIADVDAEPPVV